MKFPNYEGEFCVYLTLELGFTFLSGAGAVQNVKASPNFCSTHIRIYDGKGNTISGRDVVFEYCVVKLSFGKF